jgi:lipopolysaccharide transport system permease protein
LINTNGRCSVAGRLLPFHRELTEGALGISRARGSRSVTLHASSEATGWHSVHQWLQVRDLIRELIARDIKLRYRGSLLGITWTLLNPLAELLVLLFVFSSVFRLNIPNFGAYLFTGLLVYGWFQTSLNFATGAIVSNRELVRRPGVPSIILPIVTVASNLVHFLLSLPILFGLLILTGVHITSAVLALPLLIAIEFVFIAGLAYPVATIHVWFRDTQHVLRVALQLLFYLTPIFYEASSVPARLQPVYRLNPLAHMVDAYRAVLIRGESPNPTSLLYLTLVSFALLLVGVLWFRRASHRFADEL